MRVTLIFDNTGSQDIEKKHVIKMNFEQLTRCLCKKFRKLQGANIYECTACDMIIASDANRITTPDFPIITSLAKTTVFENIMHNTIQMIEVTDDNHIKTIYVPSKIDNLKNQYQRLHVDGENNLHIQCDEKGIFK